jgi:hypothetical protein
MRLSEERIRFIAKQAARRMIEEGAVEPGVGELNLRTLIAQVLISDMQVEEQIDAQARESVARQRRLVEGTPEYEAAFQQAKAAIAAKRGYPL